MKAFPFQIAKYMAKVEDVLSIHRKSLRNTGKMLVLDIMF